MKSTKLIALASCVAAGAALAFYALAEHAEDDPFLNMYAMIYQQDWHERQIPGSVSDYQAPIFVQDMPDVDWGATSIHFTTDLPLEDELIGTFADDQFRLYCYQQSLLAISENIETMPKTNMPAEIFQQALEEIAYNSAYDDGPEGIYIRQCYGVVRPRDPETYNQQEALSGFEGQNLLGRCANEIQKRFRGVGAMEYDPDVGAFYVLRVAPVHSPDGVALGALCRQTAHPSGTFHMFTWFLTRKL